MLGSLSNDPRRWRVLMVLVLILGTAWIAASRTPGSAGTANALRASPQEGFLAPDFTLPAADGTQVLLSSLRGKVVVVNLWASWCPPCRAEMPAMEKVYQANRARGFEVLAVDATYQDQESDARAFAAGLSLSYPILYDRDGAVGQRYLLRALPTSFFIDRRGVIRSIVVGGPMAETLIASKAEDLLREAP